MLRPHFDEKSDVVSFYRFIVGDRCNALIMVQAENLATDESLVPGNRKKGWDRGIQDFWFSELYRPIGPANNSVVQSQADERENNGCDGLIRLQARNFATGESPVPGNRKKGWGSRNTRHSIF
jgi:hypothetical protein